MARVDDGQVVVRVRRKRGSEGAPNLIILIERMESDLRTVPTALDPFQFEDIAAQCRFPDDLDLDARRSQNIEIAPDNGMG